MSEIIHQDMKRSKIASHSNHIPRLDRTHRPAAALSDCSCGPAQAVGRRDCSLLPLTGPNYTPAHSTHSPTLRASREQTIGSDSTPAHYNRQINKGKVHMPVVFDSAAGQITNLMCLREQQTRNGFAVGHRHKMCKFQPTERRRGMQKQ
jgi:hypothetical protein